jgi:glucosyl-3-phosphoglycerate synthase
MSDFHQFGVVTALPRLQVRPVEHLEAAIRKLTPKLPVALVLPMTPQEMERPALARILDELCEVDYLDTLVISLNQANRDDYQATVDYFARYPARQVVLWSEARAVQTFLAELEQAGLNVGAPARGGLAGSPWGF